MISKYSDFRKLASHKLIRPKDLAPVMGSPALFYSDKSLMNNTIRTNETMTECPNHHLLQNYPE
jgi:hypothetical protein